LNYYFTNTIEINSLLDERNYCTRELQESEKVAIHSLEKKNVDSTPELWYFIKK